MKTEFKFTKGKWTSIKPEGSNGFCYVDSGSTSLGSLATCYNGSFEHKDESAYNAKLISCAPELLEALNESITLLYGTTEFEVLENYRKKINDFEQLITKATTI